MHKNETKETWRKNIKNCLCDIINSILNVLNALNLRLFSLKLKLSVNINNLKLKYSRRVMGFYTI